MTGPKLNEATREAGVSSGYKAVGRYERSSASKVRVVLDLVRGLDVKKADDVLKFTDREAARLVRKVLASAVANAVSNFEQDADDLYVKACFADEGPTLKRFRPRAKGRAGRINKRTCHITVVVAVMSEEQMAVRDAKTASRRSALSSRQARVAASRKRASSAKADKADKADTGDTGDTAEAPDTAVETAESAAVETAEVTADAPANETDDAEGTSADGTEN